MRDGFETAPGPPAKRCPTMTTSSAPPLHLHLATLPVARLAMIAQAQAEAARPCFPVAGPLRATTRATPLPAQPDLDDRDTPLSLIASFPSLSHSASIAITGYFPARLCLVSPPH